MATKNPCPITRKEFFAHAKDLVLQVGDQKLVLGVREFTTGSFGYYATGKLMLEINGKVCSVQLGCNATIAGSKDLATDEK